jgi:hypothetical protein
VFWAGSPEHFREAIAGLDRRKPGFCSRYSISDYEDLAFLSEVALRRFNEIMARIADCSRQLDRAGVPRQDAEGRDLSFWQRLSEASSSTHQA